MTDLADHLHGYLKMRRELGFKLETQGFFLAEFVRFVETSGAKTVTAESAISWAQLPEGVQSIHWARRLERLAASLSFSRRSIRKPRSHHATSSALVSNVQRRTCGSNAMSSACSRRLVDSSHPCGPRQQRPFSVCLLHRACGSARRSTWNDATSTF